MAISISTTVGSLQVKVNGTTVFNVTGAVTQQTGNSYLDNILLFLPGNNAKLTDFLLSDTILSTDIYSIWEPVNGAGASTEFTSSTVNPNYQNVDGLTQSTTYNSSNTVGNADLFTVSNSKLTGLTILALEPGFEASRDSAGTRSLAIYMKSAGGTLTTGGSYALSTGETIFGTVYANDPGTSAPWLVSALPQVGYIITA